MEHLYIPAVSWWFYCRCFHFCTAPFRGCAMYSQVLGIGWVYRCSHGNGASIPVVFWCRSSPFCISLHLYPILFKAPLTVRLHIYSHIFWPWSSWRAGTHTQELVRSIVIPFWGIVCKTFQEQLDGTVPGGCAIYLVVKKSCPRKAFVEHTHPLLFQRFDDRNVQSRKKGFKLKMG